MGPGFESQRDHLKPSLRFVVRVFYFLGMRVGMLAVSVRTLTVCRIATLDNYWQTLSVLYWQPYATCRLTSVEYGSNKEFLVLKYR